MSGIFGVVSKSNCVDVLLHGTDYHSHLGTQFAGLAVWGNTLTKKIHDIRWSQFKNKFYQELPHLKGTRGIGVISALNPQPISIKSKFGQYVICTNGFINNADRLARELMKEGDSFSDSHNGQINMTELIAKLINRGPTIAAGIESMFSRIDGSCSLLILTRQGIWAARDRLGYTPLAVARKGTDFAVSTETSAFLNLDFLVQKVLGPGEIVFVGNDGIEVKKAAGKTNQICSFLWIYTGFPASSYEGINVEIVRERCGRLLARNDDIKPDFAAGIPDSGTTHAIGYAMERDVPFRRPLVKYTPGYDRSYTPPLQSTRDLIAKMKLLAIKEIIAGRKVVICDDSIVRGTQLKNFTIQKLRSNGVKEIHLRIACPPLMFPCKFNFSTRALSELVSRRAIRAIEKKDLADVSRYLDEDSPSHKAMVKWIAEDLNVTSLKYQRLDDMVEAIGLPKDQLCTYCWKGDCGKS